MYTKLSSILFIAIYARSTESALRGASPSDSSATQNHQRKLVTHTISGDCTVASFSAGVGGIDTLASYLGKSSSDTVGMQQSLDIKCADALVPQM